MNSDLSERKEEEKKRAKMPFLGRTLGRGPTKIDRFVNLINMNEDVTE